MPEYRSLRKNHTILELCKNPELAAQVTLQPIEALEVDAAIIFADLLLPVEPMGMKLEFLAGEGPALTPPIRSLSQIEALNTQNGADLGYVPEAISLVKRELDGKVPLIGFVGAPFTLASYMIEGGGSRHYLQTKRLMYGEPAAWNALMTKIVDVLGALRGGAGQGRSRRHPGLRQLGGRALARRLRDLHPAAFKTLDPNDSTHRSPRDSFWNGRGVISRSAAQSRRRCVGTRLACSTGRSVGLDRSRAGRAGEPRPAGAVRPA